MLEKFQAFLQLKKKVFNSFHLSKKIKNKNKKQTNTTTVLLL